MPRGIQKGNKAVKPRVYLEDHCAASLGRQIKGTRKSDGKARQVLSCQSELRKWSTLSRQAHGVRVRQYQNGWNI